jgi:hypothetical protein
MMPVPPQPGVTLKVRMQIGPGFEGGRANEISQRRRREIFVVRELNFPKLRRSGISTGDVAPTELGLFADGCSTNMPRLRRWFAADRPANPAAGFVQDAARVAPSPWGEGRVEGGRGRGSFFSESQRGGLRGGGQMTARPTSRSNFLGHARRLEKGVDGVNSPRASAAIGNGTVVQPMLSLPGGTGNLPVAVGNLPTSSQTCPAGCRPTQASGLCHPPTSTAFGRGHRLRRFRK